MGGIGFSYSGKVVGDRVEAYKFFLTGDGKYLVGKIDEDHLPVGTIVTVREVRDIDDAEVDYIDTRYIFSNGYSVTHREVVSERAKLRGESGVGELATDMLSKVRGAVLLSSVVVRGKVAKNASQRSLLKLMVEEFNADTFSGIPNEYINEIIVWALEYADTGRCEFLELDAEKLEEEKGLDTAADTISE